MNEIGSVAGLCQAEMNEKMRQAHEEGQRANLKRRFNQLVANVLRVVHIDHDNYGPLSINEPQDQAEFKAKITAICKEYL